MTSRLYPRLTPAAALPLLNLHRLRSLSELRDLGSSEPIHSEAMFAATGGFPATTDHLQMIAARIREAAGTHGYPQDVSESSRVAADRTMARVLHQTVEIVPAEAAVADVWTFMTMQLLPDITAWRFPKSIDDQRWICSDITRHTLGRLWWQAHVLAVPAGSTWDYRLLDALSESDLNQVFERRSIGGRPALARAVVQTMSTEINSGESTVKRRLLIRDVTRRIRRLIPFTAFVALGESELQSRVDEVFKDSIKALSAAKEWNEQDEG